MNSFTLFRILKVNIVPIVFSFFARMNEVKNEIPPETLECLLFSVFSRGWTRRLRRTLSPSRSAYCFQFFRADEPVISFMRASDWIFSAYCFQFFRADELQLLKCFNHYQVRAYCFQFFRADERNQAARSSRKVQGAYCFQFFRADEHKWQIWYNIIEVSAYCFQFFRADELSANFGFVVPGMRCLLFSVFSRGWTEPWSSCVKWSTSAYCFQFFRADEHTDRFVFTAVIEVPIVFSFFARMNFRKVGKQRSKENKCLLFSVFSRGWTLSFFLLFQRDKRAYCFQFFRADERCSEK